MNITDRHPKKWREGMFKEKQITSSNGVSRDGVVDVCIENDTCPGDIITGVHPLPFSLRVAYLRFQSSLA